MRVALMLFGIAGALCAQSFTEFGAAAAGSATGSVAGKKVSDGLSSILGKVGQQASAAAAVKPEAAEPALAKPKISRPERSSRRSADRRPYNSLVPPPPPLHAALKRSPERREKPRELEPAPISAPPPVVTAEDLRNLAVGTSREEVLKQGPPSSRVTMFDDGHLHEIFHYARNESAIGEVQLVDGAVSSVEVK